MPKVNDIQYDVTLFASIKVITPTIPNMVFTYRLFLNQVLEIDRIIVFIHYFERVHVNFKPKHTNRKYKKTLHLQYCYFHKREIVNMTLVR